MSPTAIMTALNFYKKLLVEIDFNNPMIPARWALESLIKVAFKCLPPKLKARVRLDVEQKKIAHVKCFLPLERHKLSEVVKDFMYLADKFPSDKDHLIELVILVYIRSLIQQLIFLLIYRQPFWER